MIVLKSDVFRPPSVNEPLKEVTNLDVIKSKNFFIRLISPLLNRFPKLSRKLKIMVIVAGSMFVLLILLAVVGLLVSGIKKGVFGGGVPKPSPNAIALPTTPPLNPSRYANDPDVLSVENKLNDFEKQTDKIELRETYLSLPRIEFNISFK